MRYFFLLSKVLTTTKPSYLYDLISLQPHHSTHFSKCVTLVHPHCISCKKSTTALSAMPHLVNSLKNFANLSMMKPCHCYLIFFSPVYHHHHHHHHFHFDRECKIILLMIEYVLYLFFGILKTSQFI